MAEKGGSVNGNLRWPTLFFRLAGAGKLSSSHREMKRDLELIRWILLSVERDDSILSHPQHTDAAILDHLELLVEAGLLRGEVDPPESGDGRGARIQRLSWAGHDFLDAAKNERLWERAKRTVAETGGSWTLEGLKALLVRMATDLLTGGGA